MPPLDCNETREITTENSKGNASRASSKGRPLDIHGLREFTTESSKGHLSNGGHWIVTKCMKSRLKLGRATHIVHLQMAASGLQRNA